jgi:hypothetical protein
MTKFLFAILILMNLFSCRKTYKLSTSEVKFNPYKEGDTLTFVSNTGEKDSIFLIKVLNYYKEPNQSSKLFPDRRQEIIVDVIHSDPSPPDGSHRYLTNPFLHISKIDASATEIYFNFAAKNSWFYANSYTFKDLHLNQTDTINLPAGTFTDVLTIHSNSQEYKSRDNYIKTIYWSKSTGYVGFDLLNGTVWRLEKKYGR